MHTTRGIKLSQFYQLWERVPEAELPAKKKSRNRGRKRKRDDPTYKSAGGHRWDM